MYEYFLYDWKGKIKWGYLQGVFLVDPLYENEFLLQNKDCHLRDDLQ